MISSFQLKFGRVPGAAGEQVVATPVTVFVGPNNSGKSRILSEIERYCRNGTKDAGAVILADLSFSGIGATEAVLAIERIRQPPNPGESINVDHLFVGKRVFVSTHSPSFVMGCIQSGAPVNIIRLTYRAGIATARVLPSAEILELMRHPLLRSTGVLSGLFYEFVVVTESDADRAFYQEANERLLQFRPEWGIPNCLFINAQNKQTIQTIIRPLRQLGIPAVGIVDVDVLKEGGTNWTNLLSSANVPTISHGPLAAMRAAVKSAMDLTGQDMKRHGGIAILQLQDREAAQNLLSQLADYGIFVVPGGELESWMKHLEVGGHGPSWLIGVFERMGEDPTSSNYVHPSDSDVWEFLSNVKGWLVDATRKGIPA